MNKHFLKIGFIVTVMCTSTVLPNDTASSRAFFPDPGFTCCSIVPGIMCSIAEALVIGQIFSSCPCSVICRLDPALLDDMDGNEQTAQKSLDGAGK